MASTALERAASEVGKAQRVVARAEEWLRQAEALQEGPLRDVLGLELRMLTKVWESLRHQAGRLGTLAQEDRRASVRGMRR